MKNIKFDLIIKLKEIQNNNWIQNIEPGNHGGIGNTFQSLLDIPINNSPNSDLEGWELKAKRKKSNSYITLYSYEPYPRNKGLIKKLIVEYGSVHKQAGNKYPGDEKSLRHTMCCNKESNLGFKIEVDRKIGKIFIKNNNFDDDNLGPYWDIDDIFYKTKNKLINCILAEAEVKKKKTDGHFIELYNYTHIWMLKNICLDKFINAIESGIIKIEFCARTRKNNGTKFRIKMIDLINLYDEVIKI